MPAPEADPRSLRDPSVEASLALPSTTPPDATGILPSLPTAGAPDQDSGPSVGYRFTDFELLYQLGEGAFARVFLARQLSLNRYVALKISRGPTSRASEARTLASLEHEHIVQIFDECLDPLSNRRLLYMQYVPCTTLDRILRHWRGSSTGARTPLPLERRTGQALLDLVDSLGTDIPIPFVVAPRRYRQLLQDFDAVECACWLGSCLADGLAYAHHRGVLHCDIKPANILVATDGRPLLVDFNVALDSQQAAPDRLGGTIQYMAPEQMDAIRLGQPQLVDRRSDLYSLGMVLYEMLIGQRPFADPPRNMEVRDAMRVMGEERRGGPPSLHAADPELSPVLDRLLRRCLAPAPENRYQTANDLHQALDGYRQLHRSEKAMPRAGLLTRIVSKNPQLWSILLPMLPQGAGAVIDLSYNSLWITLLPGSRHLLLPFFQLTGPYTVISLIITAIMSYRLTQPIWASWERSKRGEEMDPEEVAAVRRHSLQMPVWAMVLTALGWLPGAFCIPLVMSLMVGPIGWMPALHLILSFLVAGLIAVTYTVYAAQFMVMRIGYPSAWVDARDFRQTARAELVSVGKQVQFLPMLAVLFPLGIAAAMMLGLLDVRPKQIDDDSYRLHKLVVLVLICLGMSAYWLSQRISRHLEEIRTAFILPEDVRARRTGV